MSDRTPEPGDAGSEPDLSSTAEFAKLRAVMRASEKHREGGVDRDARDPRQAEAAPVVHADLEVGAGPQPLVQRRQQLVPAEQSLLR